MRTRRNATPLARWLVAAAGVLSMAAPALSHADDATPSPSPSANVPLDPVRVIFDEITPKAPSSKDKLRIAGRITAVGHVVDEVSIRVRIGPVLSRFDLHLQEVTPASPSGFAGTPVAGPGHLESGETGQFRIQVPLRLAPYLSRDGVHALEVEAQARLDGAADPVVVGRGDSFLPVFSDTALTPTRIAWAVTVAASTPQAQPDSALTDSHLVGLVGPNGRLTRLLTAAVDAKSSVQGAAAPPVTFVVDADLLRALHRAAIGSYKAHGSTRALPRSESAAQFLSTLAHNVTRDQLVSLATADADIVSLAEAGLGGEALTAIQDGRAGVADILGTRPRVDVVMPPSGQLPSSILDLMRSHGITTVLLDEPTFPPEPNLSYTPTALAQIQTTPGQLHAAVADQALSDLVAKGESSAPTPRMAEQLFLAETAMITSQRPAVPQSLLVKTPRTWEPGNRYGRAVIADSTTMPWLTGASVDDLLAGRDDTSVRTAAGAAPTTELLPKDVLVSDAQARATLHDFSSVFAALARKETITTPASQALFAAESAMWRSDVSTAIVRNQEATAEVDRLKGSVRAAAPRVVTLTNASSPIPVTVINELDLPVSVMLRIEATNRTRLRSNYSQPVKLAAHAKLRVDVPVHVETSGTFPVTVSAETPTGQPLGVPVRFVVRSAAYGALALWITGGALAVLLIAVATRAVRRLTSRGRAAAS